MLTLLDLCVSSLRRGHANLLCIAPVITDDPQRGHANIICIPGCSSYRSFLRADRENAADEERLQDVEDGRAVPIASIASLV